jgi:hypothetical protein
VVFNQLPRCLASDIHRLTIDLVKEHVNQEKKKKRKKKKKEYE